MTYLTGRKAGKGTYVLLGVLGAGAVVLLLGFGLRGQAKVEGTSTDDRVQSVCKLADRKPSGAGKALAQAAAKDPSPAVRQAAHIGLGRFAGPEYRDVTDKGTRDADPQVRAAAASTLGLYQDTASADRLGELAASDPDWAVRFHAAVGLGRNKTPKSIVWLLKAIEGDTDPRVQIRAMTELYKRLGMRYVGAGPAKRALWLDNIEFLKTFPHVQQAFAGASVTLDRHPEHLSTHDEPPPSNAPAK